jgi:Tfp pilus assembly protein PilF
MARAVRYFQEAIALDSSYALAYMGLAETYALAPMYDLIPTGEFAGKAYEAAVSALRLDSALGGAHGVIALVNFLYNWRWDAAELEFVRSLELNPGYSTAHHWYSVYLMAIGRFEEAVTEIRHAQQLDPLSSAIAAHLGFVLSRAGDLQPAVEELRRAELLDPAFPLTHAYLGEVLMLSGAFEEGIAEIERAIALNPESAYTLSRATLAWALAESGKRSEALSVLGELDEQALFVPFNKAEVYAGLGEIDLAFEWLETAFAQRSPAMPLMKTNPKLAALHSDPRYVDLLRRMGFPD